MKRNFAVTTLLITVVVPFFLSATATAQAKHHQRCSHATVAGKWRSPAMDP
jgi:hypothetical protein